MFMFFNNCIYHVCQLLSFSIVHTLYIHGTDMSVHWHAGHGLCQVVRIPDSDAALLTRNLDYDSRTLGP